MNTGILLFLTVMVVSYQTAVLAGASSDTEDKTCPADQETCSVTGDDEDEEEEHNPQWAMFTEKPENERVTCPENKTLCADQKTCVNRCDGTPDCPGGEDELGCAGCEDRYGLLTECIEFSRDFAIVNGYSMTQEKRKYGAGLTAEKCKARCLADAQCIHFKFQRKTGACWSIFVSLRYAIECQAFKPSKRQDTYLRACARCVNMGIYNF